MKFFKHSLVILFCGVLFSACNKSSEQGRTEQATLSDGSLLVTGFGACDTVKNQGVSISVQLWQPSAGGNAASAISDNIVAKSIKIVNSFADSASIAANPAAKTSLKGAYQVFEKNYLDFKKSAPDAPGCWQVELKGDTVMVTNKVLFYQIDNYAFTGGAHPNSFLSYHAFDTTTGDETPMSKFVSDSTALLKLVEKKFREIEKLTPGANLEDAGYFLLNHQFFLPANYVFTREGILFNYNPYEIAAYVRGHINFVIPYSELKGIVKQESVF
ncbi:DUF3298 and DUF4163 domain-containing protein [Dyadobacter luticola]|uniref:DUF3298 and DUF4163 domain-containing protein n=1 Tax=Dyadobacter luticola TaxID=1979387 RepID=A0A5R9KYL5_9BACT|nr:DUF3298 and DUF4163 domain-containing protein [Dyadobacter luticola]TLV01261.1 DUF3298 and DUF4163 domain-containing protein [Dyadobacter luticola]